MGVRCVLLVATEKLETQASEMKDEDGVQRVCLSRPLEMSIVYGVYGGGGRTSKST